jgi:hypothetical protein
MTVAYPVLLNVSVIAVPALSRRTNANGDFLSPNVAVCGAPDVRVLNTNES